MPRVLLLSSPVPPFSSSLLPSLFVSPRSVPTQCPQSLFRIAFRKCTSSCQMALCQFQDVCNIHCSTMTLPKYSILPDSEIEVIEFQSMSHSIPATFPMVQIPHH